MQAKLAGGASERRLKLRASPSILAGRIFDDRGNRMTPSHTNKQGARYRYYVSHAVFQKRHDEAGSVVRISAQDIENAVVQSVRNHLDKCSAGEGKGLETDRELIEQHVERIIVKSEAIEILLVSEVGHRPDEHGQKIDAQCQSRSDPVVVITVPWTTTASVATKGVFHSPSLSPTMSSDDRDILLTAIAKARAWIDDLVEGRVASFTEIARREGKVERHIRLLAPLAFVSPRVISGIVEGSLPRMTVTGLAKSIDYSWAAKAPPIQLI